MRALSLTQPWATFVARGLKPVENRKQYFAEVISGEPFAIHASMNWDSDAVERIKRIAAGDERLLSVLNGDHVRGAILGVASSKSYLRGFEGLDQTVHQFAGRMGAGVPCDDQRLLRWYFTTQYGYVLHDQRELADPLPCKGALSFWKVPPDVLVALGDRPWVSRSAGGESR